MKPQITMKVKRVRSFMVIGAVTTAIAMTGCVGITRNGETSVGPVVLSKEEGEMPKMHFKTGYKPCKVRGRIYTYKKEIRWDCKWHVEF